MANYDDYQLDEMENAAVDKSKNLKRGLAAGAAVLGVGGGAAFAAERIVNSDDSDESSELTSEDLLAGANAGVEETLAAEEPAALQTQEVHVNHHVIQEPLAEPRGVDPEDEPEITVDETAVLLDEDGNIVTAYDAGKVDGKDYMIIDSDQNGAGDILAYDENGNGQFEDNEISRLDNHSYQMGQGKTLNVYAQDENGEYHKIYSEQNPNHSHMADNNDGHYGENHDDIHNDFDDEKTGEFYHDDFAENNPDYNNHGGEQYSASVEGGYHDNYIDDKYDGGVAYNDEDRIDYDGMPDHDHIDYETDYAYDPEPEVEFGGYEEPGNDFASYDSGSDSFDAGLDDASSFDA